MARSTSSSDEQHAMTRRALIKWSVAAAAALGVSRTRLFEILERVAGKGVAYAAAESSATRLVALSCGNGGLSHFQLFWPQVDVARARDPRFAWHRIGEERMVDGTDLPLAIGPDTPWAGLPPERQITGFVCGVTETHVRNVQSTSVLNGNNVFSIATVLQSSSMTPVPVVTIGDTSIGSASRADAIAANVDSVDGFIKLFDSAASQAGGLLADPDDADLFKRKYDLFRELNRATYRTTQKPAYAIASGAATLVGTNHGPALRITDADLARYGIDGNTRANVAELGRALIVTAKAFQADLTNAVLMPAMTDDPHRHFAGNDASIVPGQLKVVLDAFMADLQTATDPSTDKPLADNVVIAINGDTPKHCLVRDDWPDNTPDNANLMFIYSAGYLKSGWFGSIDRRGIVLGAGGDGKPTAYNGVKTARYATACLAYAIARGNQRQIAEFTNGVTVGEGFGRNRG